LAWVLAPAFRTAASSAPIRTVVAQSEPATVFAEALQDLVDDQELPADVARRSALNAASLVVWADAVGPQLTVGQARELTGVSVSGSARSSIRVV
jgi:hypothetical protein